MTNNLIEIQYINAYPLSFFLNKENRTLELQTGNGINVEGESFSLKYLPTIVCGFCN